MIVLVYSAGLSIKCVMVALLLVAYQDHISELFFTNFKKLDKIYGSSSSNNFYIIRKLISGFTI